MPQVWMNVEVQIALWQNVGVQLEHDWLFLAV